MNTLILCKGTSYQPNRTSRHMGRLALRVHAGIVLVRPGLSTRMYGSRSHKDQGHEPEYLPSPNSPFRDRGMCRLIIRDTPETSLCVVNYQPMLIEATFCMYSKLLRTPSFILRPYTSQSVVV